MKQSCRMTRNNYSQFPQEKKAALKSQCSFQNDQSTYFVGEHILCAKINVLYSCSFCVCPSDWHLVKDVAIAKIVENMDQVARHDYNYKHWRWFMLYWYLLVRLGLLQLCQVNQANDLEDDPFTLWYSFSDDLFFHGNTSSFRQQEAPVLYHPSFNFKPLRGLMCLERDGRANAHIKHHRWKISRYLLCLSWFEDNIMSCSIRCSMMFDAISKSTTINSLLFEKIQFPLSVLWDFMHIICKNMQFELQFNPVCEDLSTSFQYISTCAKLVPIIISW